MEGLFWENIFFVSELTLWLSLTSNWTNRSGESCEAFSDWTLGCLDGPSMGAENSSSPFLWWRQISQLSPPLISLYVESTAAGCQPIRQHSRPRRRKTWGWMSVPRLFGGLSYKTLRGLEIRCYFAGEPLPRNSVVLKWDTCRSIHQK